MKKLLYAFMLVSLTLCLSAVAAVAQSTAGVTGTVKDSNGAVIAGADVKLTDTKTGAELNTKTNDQGVYEFQKVAPGIGYTLTFTNPGFQTLVINDVALGVGVTSTHNAELTIGEVTGTVVVTASNEVTLNTTDASIGNVIGERRLKDLPIQLRNSPAALIGLQPGVVGNNVGAGTANRVGSVTGARADQGNITVDGIDVNDVTTGQFAATVGNAPIDAIQEFRAVSTNPGASEGRSSGGQVELVTKGGTNEFHGNVREYNRTAATAANSFFNNRAGIPRPALTRNQFGGSIGGPVMKDALFFFFDYEGRRDAQQVSNLRIVPLNHWRNGGLGFINNNAGCGVGSRLNVNPNCITVLTPGEVAALDPAGVGGNSALLSFINSRYPQANDLTAGDGVNTGGFRFNAPSKREDNTYTTRIDWNATSAHKLFGRFNIARRVQTDTVNSVAAQFPGDPETGQIIVRDYTWVVGHTWTVSPTFVNQATVGVARSGLLFPRNFKPAFPNSFTFGMGLSAPFASISEQDRFVPVPTIRDDATWTRGTHSIEFGGSFKPIKQKSGLVNDFNFPSVGIGGLLGALDPSLRPATIASNTNTTITGNYDSAFSFLLGRYASVATNFNYDPEGNAFAPGTGKKREYRYDEFELYVQDNWRIRNNLTLNFGLRWHLYPAPYEANGFQAAQDVDMRTLFDLRQRQNATGVRGDTVEPFLRYDLIGKANNARSLYETDLNNFGPRFGFAYTPAFKSGFLGALFGDNRTVIRGGGSVVYDRPSGAITFIQDQVSYLFDNSATTLFGEEDTAAEALLNNPRFTGISTLPVANVAPTITRPFTPFVDSGFPFGLATGEFNYAVDQRFRIPYSIQYSFGFQRELPGNFILEASYVGRQGRKLFSQADVAQALNFRDPASGQLMFDAFNALQAPLQAGTTAGTALPALIASIPNQPWFENQMNAAVQANFGVANCQALVGVSCTRFLLNNGTSRQFVLRGDTSDQVQRLFAQGLLLSNVGMSAQFGTNIYISNQGASSYDGMLVSLRKRFSQGLQFDFNYTWSHSIDNGSSITNTVAGGLVCDLTNLRVCRGNSDFDIRHLVNANFIYELPFGRGQRFGGGAPGWVNQIIGGWEFTGIFTARSGLPFGTTTTAFPVGFNFNSPAAYNLSDISGLTGNIHDATNGTIQFFDDPQVVFNPARPTEGTIRFPHHGEIGNRNVFRGPSFWNLDTALLKTFKMPWSEQQSLQIRWESFNAFNHNSFGLPAVGITGTNFGQITTSASAPREMQFAIRYSF
ncbi:MAG TPA: carboxypeptidase-like regulatory domain-containing protein [Pyrinomonadaceae bacterium]|nr:carboxypeptidase-like regulatory domain-containing protein [Pyrinomonadaceae bacterium]